MVAVGTDDRRKVVGGVLQKWTNYVSGWQLRYFEITDGCLVYYKSKAEKVAGCRGSVSLKSAKVQPTDDFNHCSFSVRINDDVIWYLRAETAALRDRWVRKLTVDYDSDYSSKGHSRTPSIASSNVSHQPEPKEALIAERILELGSYRELCEAQMQEIEKELEQVVKESSSPLVRQKLLTLKATHIAMLSNVDRILQLAAETTEMAPVHQRLHSPLQQNGSASASGPPKRVETTPSTDTLKAPSASAWASGNGVQSDDEECWHDAASERGGTEEEDEEPTTSRVGAYATARSEGASSSASSEATVTGEGTRTPSEGTVAKKEAEEDRHLPYGCFDRPQHPDDHHLAKEVSQLAKDQLDYALTGASDPTMWTLFASDGEMRMYKREIEQDGLPVDPLKALHTVRGVTALEFMHYFFDAQYKKSWDHTLEDMKVIEKIGDDLIVLHQKHKTVWPAAPRESLFVSHLRRVDEWKSPGAYDCYIVCNKDIKRDDVPLGTAKSVRVGLTVSMICETHIDNPKNLPLSELPRSAFSCKIIYVSSVHPGGWVPTAALRHVYKREYPKFLRTFTDFVLSRVKHQKRVAI